MAKRNLSADAEDVARCLDGDREAFGGLVRRYRALAVGVAFSVCRDRAMAEDVAQEGFIRAYRSLRQLARHESFCAWLVNIVKNAALRAARNVSRRKEVHKEPWADLGPYTENPTASLEFAELLAQVDAESQRVLTLKYLHGMTCVEIGSELGMPVGTVTSKISRALGSLREAAHREQRRMR